MKSFSDPGPLALTSWILLILQFVECILASESAEGALQIVQQCARSVGFCPISTDARAEGDVMIYRRLVLAGVSEVGFLVVTSQQLGGMWTNSLRTYAQIVLPT